MPFIRTWRTAAITGRRGLTFVPLAAALLPALTSVALGGEVDWAQFKYDARRSGNVPQRRIDSPLGLEALSL